MTVTHLQIFGERCSGTNYVAELLRRNLPQLQSTDRYGWKHGLLWQVRDEAPDCLFVVVHRDPFDWVRSLHRTPWHAAAPLRDLTLSQFLRAQWWCEWGRDMPLAAADERHGTEMLHERDPETKQRHANVLRMRTTKLRTWATLPERVRHCVAVRYEDVLADERAFVRDVAASVGARRRLWHRGVRTFKGGSSRFVRRDYEPFAPEDVDWVLAQLDADVERAAGYDLAAAAARVRGEGPAV